MTQSCCPAIPVSCAHDLSHRASPVRFDIRPAVARIAQMFATYLAHREQRRALLRLDDRMLADIGISRAEAEEEFRKSGLFG